MTTMPALRTLDGSKDASVIPPAVRDQYTRMFDGLTALPGWALLIDRTHISLERARRHDLLVAVVVLSEVRRASSVSPNLASFVSFLRSSLYGDDTVSRIDGSTFVIVLNDVATHDTVAMTVQELINRSGILCRVGIAFGASPQNAAELIMEALDQATPPPPPPAATPWWEGFDDFASDQRA
jgi:GGDEF domain-containing protein